MRKSKVLGKRLVYVKTIAERFFSLKKITNLLKFWSKIYTKFSKHVSELSSQVNASNS